MGGLPAALLGHPSKGKVARKLSYNCMFQARIYVIRPTIKAHYYGSPAGRQLIWVHLLIGSGSRSPRAAPCWQPGGQGKFLGPLWGTADLPPTAPSLLRSSQERYLHAQQHQAGRQQPSQLWEAGGRFLRPKGWNPS